MFLIAFLACTAFAIVLVAMVWAWANGTLVETPQERIDRQFDQIVRNLLD